ncbi:hypothetical protein [Nocardioides sp. CPCC 206347]|uniref:hypothetical protein n=1 Tax=Nocardioides sp. CPCC 206347 TaxID=3406463 RepID=UPI003B438538
MNPKFRTWATAAVVFLISALLNLAALAFIATREPGLLNEDSLWIYLVPVPIVVTTAAAWMVFRRWGLLLGRAVFGGAVLDFTAIVMSTFLVMSTLTG